MSAGAATTPSCWRSAITARASRRRELARIFERFERAASIRNYGGLGLGLYFIQAIVDAHGGSVTAQNASDGGARFQITLPLRTTVAAADGDLQPADVN